MPWQPCSPVECVVFAAYWRGDPSVSCSPTREAEGTDPPLPEVQGVWNPQHVRLRQAVVVVEVPSGQVQCLAEVQLRRVPF